MQSAQPLLYHTWELFVLDAFTAENLAVFKQEDDLESPGSEHAGPKNEVDEATKQHAKKKGKGKKPEILSGSNPSNA